MTRLNVDPSLLEDHPSYEPIRRRDPEGWRGYNGPRARQRQAKNRRRVSNRRAARAMTTERET